MFARLFSLTLISLLIGLVPAAAQTLPPCTERANWTFNIRAKPEYYCVEFVLQDASAGEMSFTALAFAPDGRLFATRPLQGQVLMLRDTDGDTQPDSPQVVAEGLDRPNALLYYDGALYIGGRTAIYRLSDNSPIKTLIDDLPVTGLWHGGLATDGTWLYIGTSASCDTCDTLQTGAVLRLPLAGGDSEVYASGFRQPLGLLWHDEALWVTDSARFDPSPPARALDELNRVEAGRDYGYPGCVGLLRTPADETYTQSACDDTIAPIISFSTYSQPSAVVIYRGEAFPHLEGEVLMALMGSTNRSDVRGYGVIAFPFPPQPPFPIEMVLPYDSSITNGAEITYDSEGVALFDLLSFLNRRGVGLWPHHLYGLAVSPEGWIYLSVGGGTILSLRPR